MNLNLNGISYRPLKIAENQMFKSNPICFRGAVNDTFEKSSAEKHDISSELDFLYDNSLTEQQKDELLKRHPNLVKAADVAKNIGQYTQYWYKPACFETIRYKPSQYKSCVRLLLDTTDTKTKENLDKLISQKEHIMNAEQFLNHYNMSFPIYREYIKSGALERVTLKNKNNADVPITIINIDTEANHATIERFAKIAPIDTPMFKMYQSDNWTGDEETQVDFSYLVNLKVASYDELAELVENKKIKGTLDGSTDGKVNVYDRDTEQVLRKLRSKRCRKISDVSNASGIPLNKIEELALNGELKLIREKLFIGDEESMIDITNKRNLLALEKLQFEQKLKKDIKATSNIDDNNNIKAISSLKMKIVWHLCPKTKMVSRKIIKCNPKIAEVMRQKNEIKRELELLSKENPEYGILEEKLAKLNKTEDLTMRSYYKLLWSKAGTDEYRAAQKTAAEIIKQFKSKGINSIEDEEIREIIIQHNSNN